MFKKHPRYPPFIPMSLLGLGLKRRAQCYKIGFLANFPNNAVSLHFNQNTSSWSHFFLYKIHLSNPVNCNFL